jgi:hypothetical protein
LKIRAGFFRGINARAKVQRIFTQLRLNLKVIVRLLLASGWFRWIDISHIWENRAIQLRNPGNFTVFSVELLP